MRKFRCHRNTRTLVTLHSDCTYSNRLVVFFVALIVNCPTELGIQFLQLRFQLIDLLVLFPLSPEFFHTSVDSFQQFSRVVVHGNQTFNLVERFGIRAVDAFQLRRFHEKGVLVFCFAGQKFFGFLLVQDGDWIFDLNIAKVGY